MLVGLVIVSLVLATGFAIPVLAHGPGDGETALADQETWEAIHKACESGDWALEDPAGKTLKQARKIRDEIRERVKKVLEET